MHMRPIKTIYNSVTPSIYYPHVVLIGYQVVHPKDQEQLGKKVAVKIIRGNEVMFKTGLRELALLKEVRLLIMNAACSLFFLF